MSDTTETPSESTALVVLPKADLVFVPGGSAPLLAAIRARATAEATSLDVTKPKDREAIASLVWKLRRTKTAIDDAGKTLKSDYQTKITPIDAERRAAREGMDDLIEEIDAPLAAFKMREELRLRGHETTLAEIEGWSAIPEDWTSAQITARMEELKAHPYLEREWQEYETKAKSAVRNAYNALVAARVAVQEREAAARLAAEQEAERQRLEALRLAQEQRAREETAARIAAEAATRAAEARAQQQAEEAAAAAQALLDAAAARERAQAEALAGAEAERLAGLERERVAAARAEATRVTTLREALGNLAWAGTMNDPMPTSAAIQARIAAVEALPPRDWQEFAERAAAALEATMDSLRGQLGTAIKREADREAAVEAQRQAAQQAREHAAAEAATQAAQRRQQLEAEKVEAARLERERNVAYQAQVHREAALDLQQRIQMPDGHSLSKELAKAIVTALVKGQIRHCRLEY